MATHGAQSIFHMDAFVCVCARKNSWPGVRLWTPCTSNETNKRTHERQCILRNEGFRALCILLKLHYTRSERVYFCTTRNTITFTYTRTHTHSGVVHSLSLFRIMFPFGYDEKWRETNQRKKDNKPIWFRSVFANRTVTSHRHRATKRNKLGSYRFINFICFNPLFSLRRSLSLPTNSVLWINNTAKLFDKSVQFLQFFIEKNVQ